MVRKGWTQVEVPNGWVQLIRGPRQRSVQWPRASKDGKLQEPRQHGAERIGSRMLNRVSQGAFHRSPWFLTPAGPHTRSGRWHVSKQRLEVWEGERRRMIGSFLEGSEVGPASNLSWTDALQIATRTSSVQRSCCMERKRT